MVNTKFRAYTRGIIPTKTSEIENDVPFVEAKEGQTLTDEQKKWARENIDAVALLLDEVIYGEKKFDKPIHLKDGSSLEVDETTHTLIIKDFRGQTVLTAGPTGLDLNNVQVHSIANPTNPQDAATKHYVDEAFTNESLEDVVRYTAQTKNDNEKQQARMNIGAAGADDLGDVIDDIGNMNFGDMTATDLSAAIRELYLLASAHTEPDGDTTIYDSNHKIQAVKIKDGNGEVTVSDVKKIESDIEEIERDIQNLEGQGGILNPTTTNWDGAVFLAATGHKFNEEYSGATREITVVNQPDNTYPTGMDIGSAFYSELESNWRDFLTLQAKMQMYRSSYKKYNNEQSEIQGFGTQFFGMDWSGINAPAAPTWQFPIFREEGSNVTFGIYRNSANVEPKIGIYDGTTLADIQVYKHLTDPTIVHGGGIIQLFNTPNQTLWKGVLASEQDSSIFGNVKDKVIIWDSTYIDTGLLVDPIILTIPIGTEIMNLYSRKYWEWNGTWWVERQEQGIGIANDTELGVVKTKSTATNVNDEVEFGVKLDINNAMQVDQLHNYVIGGTVDEQNRITTLLTTLSNEGY